jgi:integrase
MSTRNEKGKVAIESIDGWLRLRWRVAGKQYALRIGLPDSKANQVVAQNKANQIHLDVISGNFDPTLDKYRPPRHEESVLVKSSVLIDVYGQFCKYKSRQLDPRTFEKYETVGKQLKEYHKNKELTAIASEDVEGFWHYLEKLGLGKHTLKGKAVLLAAFGKWAVGQNLIQENHWQDLPKWVRLSASEAPKPFSPEETKKILAAFNTNRYYKYYYPFVLFCFSTGVRLSEAIGLQWKRLSDDCTKIEIAESLSRKVRKPTKTNRTRYYKLPASVAEMLQKHKPEGAQPEDLVFLTPKGHSIDDHNFRNRAWVAIIEAEKIPYRKPYSMRSTFISHALASGMNPMTVAQITGHDPEIMFKHYAGVIDSTPAAPELY